MNEHESTASVAPGATVPPGSVQAALETGSVLADRYEIRRLLGAGGYSHVYAAWDATLGREIAVKVLRADRLSPTALKRLRREVLVAQKTRNPNLLRIYDFAQDGDQVFLTMELVPGRSLREKILVAPLPVEEAVRIAKDVLEGLHELHLSGVVHRDVKPGNILMDDSGAVRLADFGLVRELDSDESRATATDAVIGTFRYVSPEQALGRDVDARSDLFSLGIVLFEMLTQKSPFENATSLGTILAHLNRKAPDIRTIRPDVPRWLAAVVARLLERRPDFRYPSALAVIEDLERHRARIAPARVRRMAASLAILATLATVTFVSMRPRPQLDRIFIESGQPARAVNVNGETIWTRDDMTHREATTIVDTPYGRRVATFLNTEITGPRLGTPRELTFLDAETGEVVETATLPEPAINFDDLPKNFAVQSVFATDIEGDGWDEVVITWVHIPYYPSFTLVHFPSSGISQFVFAASGHHRASWAADVDGDGSKEIILAGINNRMGWHSAVAAVRVEPPVDLPKGQPQASGIPSSPDTTLFAQENVNRDRIVFYTLLPEGPVANEGVRVDDASRMIHVRLFDGRTIDVTFDGFIDSDRSDLPAGERNELRRQAYQDLRASSVESTLGRGEDGLRLAQQAIERADKAGDSILSTWSRRVAAQRHAELGNIEEAVAEWNRLAELPGLSHGVAWDAGRALHVAGLLDEAVSWYERGVAGSGRVSFGRMRYEYMQGTSLALAEAGRGVELRSRAAAWRAAFGRSEYLSHYESFARWIDGLPIRWSPDHAVGQGSDLERLWEYEFRLSAGESHATLLEQFDGEAVPVAVPLALVASLRAELLAGLGRGDEALDEARKAWAAVLAAPPDDIVTRAHRRLIGERVVRQLRTRGLRDEAARIDVRSASR